jgi:PAS domain S-box-containing protein
VTKQPARRGPKDSAPRPDFDQPHAAVHLRMVERYSLPSLLINQDQRVVHLSEQAGRFLQHPRGDPTTSVFELVREELRVELSAVLHAAREARDTARSRWVLMKIGGEVRRIVIRASAPTEGEFDGLTLVTFDELEALELSEVALRESEARFRAVAGFVPDLLWQISPEGSATWFNTRWHAYTGQSSAEASGHGWLNAIHPEDRQSFRAALIAAQKERQGFAREYRVRSADGKYQWHYGRIDPIRDDAGRIKWWFGAAADVNDRVQAVEQVGQLVAERAAELASTTTKLESVALERESLRRQLAAAEEDERRRLARELHDQLGQNVTGMSLGLADARRLVREGKPVDGRLAQLEEVARSLIRDARFLALELRPPELDDAGLASAVETYAKEWSRRFNIPLDIAVTGFEGQNISDDTGTALYRIIQEALTNIAKHAGAKQVSVTLERIGREIRATVEDDGRGFDVATVMKRTRAERRLGLAGINERAILADGTAELESTIGQGTSLFVRLPL